jgi:hypothetical protein
MPKKKAVPVPTVALSEPPVVFFLRVSPEEQEDVSSVVPDEDQTSASYSDILAGQIQHQNRFDEKLVHELLSKIHLQTEYSPHTACFWCCHGFTWRPFVIPIHYDAYLNKITGEGHYCSPECSLASLYQSVALTDSQKWYRHSLVRMVYSKLYGNKDIVAAPHRHALRMFGGTMDIQQYREYIWHSEIPITIELPPVRLYVPSMSTHIPARDVKKYVTLSTETMEKASNQLRIKRSKPVHANVPTLDQCMKKE